MKKAIFIVCFVSAANLLAYGQPRRGPRIFRPPQNQPAPGTLSFDAPRAGARTQEYRECF